jgi:hypothetical protein
MVLPFVLMCIVPADATECSPYCGPGRWSTDTIDLMSRKVKAPYKDRDIRIDSPDHQKSFHVVNDHWWVEVGAKRVSVSHQASDLLYPAEMA